MELAKYLNVTQYKDWFHCLRKNDLDSAMLYLENKRGLPDFDKILNGKFTYQECDNELIKELHCLSYPLFICLASKSFDVFEYILQEGCFLLQQDENGYNVLHSLIILAVQEKKQESSLVDSMHFLFSVVSNEQKIALIHMKNNEGLKPLEFACQQFTTLFIDALMHQYSNKNEIGPILVETFDVTEYERNGTSEDRRIYSPMLLLAFIDNSEIMQKKAESLLALDWFSNWYKNKIKVAKIPLIIWFAIRVIFIFLFYLYMQGSLPQVIIEKEAISNCNYTVPLLSKKTNLGLKLYLMFHSTFAIVINIFQIYKLWPVIKTMLISKCIKNRRRSIPHHAQYTICDFVFYLFLLISCPFLHSYNPWSWGISSILYCLSVSYVMNLLQLVPVINSFIFTIRAMLIILLQFFLILCICQFMWACAIRHVIILMNEDKCEWDYADFYEAVFNVFRLTVNISELSSYSKDYVIALRIIHIVFNASISVLITNVLITSMVEWSSKLSEYRNSFDILTLLALSNSAQHHADVFLPCLFGYIKKKQFDFKNGLIQFKCAKTEFASNETK